MSSLTDKKDLTRWNRSGLSRFRYVDGNAITFLETLRQAQRNAFTKGGKLQWQSLETAIPEAPKETPAEQQVRWLQQYHDDRRDYGWEILRSYARASHILGEYINVYANESFIRTATQWRSVRRLVEMLDYHPAPPASAETPIVLFTRDEQSGNLKAGFAFKNSPTDGGKPAIFETLSDLEVDYRLNELRTIDWDKSQIDFVYDDVTNSAVFPLTVPIEDVSVGTLGVLLVEQDEQTKGLAVKITALSDQQIELLGEDRPAGFPVNIRRHQVRLLLEPDFKQIPKIGGDNVVILKPDHGLSTHAAIAWEAGHTWAAAFVEAVQGERVRLSRASPPPGTSLYLLAHSEAQKMPPVVGEDIERVILPTTDYRKSGVLFTSDLIKLSSTNSGPDGAYTYLDGKIYDRIYYLPKEDAATAARVIATVLTSKPQSVVLDGDPGDLATGDWMILQNGQAMRAARIDTLIENAKDYQLELSGGTYTGNETLFGNFEVELRPLNHAVNEEPVFLTGPEYRSDSHSFLPLEARDFAELLSIGRVLVVEGKNSAMKVIVKGYDEAHRHWIKVEPAIPGSELTASGDTDDYTRYHTKIYGNIVQSGHGETRKEKILGSGDATQSNQQFDFNVENVSFVADQNFANGVRSTLTIQVDNRIWQQVSTLNDSEPEDAHYVVRMKEDGTLHIQFGDGIHGRRLPTGSNNIRIVHRAGGGLSGNLAAYSLKKAVKPDPLIDSILQPIPSSGGNNMETVESMRENAPASILTLERAVSLSDFTHLAMSYSGVWQARAFRRQQESLRKKQIEVAIVPAGGGALGSLADRLTAYLGSHALPGVMINIVPFESIILDLKITISVKADEFDQEIVKEDVLQALIKAFALQNSKLGHPRYLSEVFEVVEGVTGVANSQCIINPAGFRNASGNPVTPRQISRGVDGAIKRISVNDQQVIYIDENVSVIDITTQVLNV